MTDIAAGTAVSASPVGLLRVMRSLREEGDAAHDGLARLVRRDADAILETLAASRLVGPFVGLADGTPVFAALPEEARRELRTACLRQREVNDAYLRLLAEYMGLLEREGVSVLLLKGLHIAQRFHGTLDQRFMWDADALVQPADYQRAIRLAGGLGMRVRGRNSPRWLLRLASLHATEVRREAQSIDIHWCLRARPGYRIDYSAVWSRACAMDIGGHTFRVLSDEDALLLAVLEMASDMERSRIKLRSLWDFYLMLATLDDTLDWPAFLERRRPEGLLPLCANMLSFGLFCLDGHGTFPGLAGALGKYTPLLTLDSADTARAILARPRKHLANRSVYAGLQPAPAPFYWLHRALTSPLRKALS